MEQHSETLKLLRSAEGAKFAAFLGARPGEFQGFIASLEKQRKEAQKE